MAEALEKHFLQMITQMPQEEKEISVVAKGRRGIRREQGRRDVLQALPGSADSFIGIKSWCIFGNVDLVPIDNKQTSSFQKCGLQGHSGGSLFDLIIQKEKIAVNSGKWIMGSGIWTRDPCAPCVLMVFPPPYSQL